MHRSWDLFINHHISRHHVKVLQLNQSMLMMEFSNEMRGANWIVPFQYGNKRKNSLSESVHDLHEENMKGTCTIFVLAAALSALGLCKALDCYVCSGTDCADPLDTTSAPSITCPAPNLQCATFRIGLIYNRTCAPPEICALASCTQSICGSCCDQDLCNSAPLPTPSVPALRTFNCYQCQYRSDTGRGTACKDPLDPSSEDVQVVPCNTSCALVNRKDNGVTQVGRTCSPPTGQLQCFPGCYPPPFDGCASCCSENLCNGGNVSDLRRTTPVPATPSKGVTTTLQMASIPLMALVRYLVM
ncbi:uncharacterized protein LOC110983135 [Acanthaster planci]|uniref:Uncharacterized protein LOC110983135 n=1 Tax=Acanthaster planci TaxID=133434 RepID=A0A8B7Z376_ACAPL|nr:uncharacterized protein LOC110983135 [Acanthaster planci]